MDIAKKIYQKIFFYTMPFIMKYWVNIRFSFKISNSRHNLPSPLVISLTSYPKRFNTLSLTLKCLLMQKTKADDVVLWIAQADKNFLPKSVTQLEKKGLKINFCEDLRSYKKIIPLLKINQEIFIATADDDLYYRSTWLKELVDEYVGEKELICHRAHRIRLGIHGNPVAYVDWDLDINETARSCLNFPTTGGGVLFPPKSFLPEVTNQKIFEELCPDADDIWLYWMSAKNGYLARKIGPRRPLIAWRSSQESTLYAENMIGGGNDRKILRMVEEYGFKF